MSGRRTSGRGCLNFAARNAYGDTGPEGGGRTEHALLRWCSDRAAIGWRADDGARPAGLSGKGSAGSDGLRLRAIATGLDSNLRVTLQLRFRAQQVLLVPGRSAGGRPLIGGSASAGCRLGLRGGAGAGARCDRARAETPKDGRARTTDRLVVLSSDLHGRWRLRDRRRGAGWIRAPVALLREI
jgi:hypothetical protein